ncbi:MAG TPA: hypothetical protein PKA16_11395 [Ottowia sp.]|uniref:hypothetical protein n=1 Tax=Ottowia sp. TaxID=1898956 RepID=UPI002C5161E3|nr:hypothetical protein [Ottowia sp.]HMN21981.1 hypothetical protein [Ottowia sp.]
MSQPFPCAMPCLLPAVGAPPVMACAQAQGQREQVVYHIDDTAAPATRALRNIGNHPDLAPEAQAIMVAHAGDVDFLPEGARDAKDTKNS